MRDSWRRAPLGEITREESERVGHLKDQVTVLSSTKHHGLVRSSEYFKNRQIHSDDITNYRLVRPGWFAYATNHLSEGSIGLYQMDELGCVSPIYTVFSCRPDIHDRYLFRLLKSPKLVAQYGLNDQASVDRRGAVRYRDFSKIEVDLPPVGEQRRIAEILDELDTQIGRLEKLARKEHTARRAELLTRFYGATPKKFFVRELLKSRPRNGYSPKEADAWNGTLMLGLGCLTPRGFCPKQLKFAPEEIDGRHRAILHDGDLLVSRANTRELVGLAGVYRDVGNPCIYPDLMMRLEPIDEIPGEMLELALSIPESRRRIQAQAQGTSESMAKIASDVIMNLEVPMPDHEARQGLMQALDDARHSVSVHDAAIRKATDIKKGLVADLVACEVTYMSRKA